MVFWLSLARIFVKKVLVKCFFSLLIQVLLKFLHLSQPLEEPVLAKAHYIFLLVCRLVLCVFVCVLDVYQKFTQLGVFDVFLPQQLAHIS